MKIQPVVEGHGEVEAVPILLRRLIDEAGAWRIGVGRFPVALDRGGTKSEAPATSPGAVPDIWRQLHDVLIIGRACAGMLQLSCPRVDVFPTHDANLAELNSPCPPLSKVSIGIELVEYSSTSNQTQVALIDPFAKLPAGRGLLGAKRLVDYAGVDDRAHQKRSDLSVSAMKKRP